MDIAEFDTKDEAAAFFKLTSKEEFTETWVGFTDRKNQGRFERISDGKEIPLPWGKNEPNNAGNREHCVERSRITVDGYNDYECDSKLKVACQVFKKIY